MTKREEAAKALLDWFHQPNFDGSVGAVVEKTMLSYIDIETIDMLDLVDVVMSSLANSEVT